MLRKELSEKCPLGRINLELICVAQAKYTVESFLISENVCQLLSVDKWHL